MALSTLAIKKLTCPPDKKHIKKSDGNGLFIKVMLTGSKLWYFRYKYSNKHQELALGNFKIVPLSVARKLAIDARLLLAQGINPMQERTDRKRASNPKDLAFQVIALNWWNKKKDDWGEDHKRKVKRWIKRDMMNIGGLHITQIDSRHIIDLMLSIEASVSSQQAYNIFSIINRIFSFAIAHTLVNINPCQNIFIKDILKSSTKVSHFAAIIKENELSQLIKDIDKGKAGEFCAAEALKIAPRLFLRPKQIRTLKWEYIDFTKNFIVFPADVMKKEREHLVPMSHQVIGKLKDIQRVTGAFTYVFPNQNDSNKCMSKNVLTNTLKALGYSSEVMSAHGFRTTSSTILHESGMWSHDAIEVQLSHLVGSSTSRAYNRALHLPERKEMMQWWSDYLENLN